MELDDFKDIYNRAAGEATPANQNINDIITRESKAPLARVQKNVKFAVYLYLSSMIVGAALFVPFIGVNDVVRGPIGWIIFIFFTEFLISVINHFTLNKLQERAGDIMGNMVVKVNLLKQRYRWYLVLNTALFWVMPLFIELDVHFHLTGQFAGVGKINVFIRLAWYVVIFGGMFMIKKESQRQYYDQYLDKLKGLLVQMQ